MRGRKPIPSAMKELAGNPGHRPLNAHEPRPESAIPACPAHLQGEAKKEWRRLTKELAAVNVVSRMDRAALAALCQAWARWVAAEEELKKTGPIVKSPSGFPIQNPYLAVANKSMEPIVKLSAEFGLTPSSRTRISATAPKSAGDELADFMNDAPPMRIAE
jgi:P27 family predicted phage terminase small subunit